MADITTLQILILSGIALMGGMITAISGGGGLLVLPALLMSGIPAQIALGTNKFLVSGGTFTSASYYIRKKLVNPILWKAALVATLMGSLSGALLAIVIPNTVLELVTPLILIATSITMMLPLGAHHKNDRNTADDKPCAFKSVLISSVVGVYSGFMGPGAGSIWHMIAIR